LLNVHSRNKLSIHTGALGGFHMQLAYKNKVCAARVVDVDFEKLVAAESYRAPGMFSGSAYFFEKSRFVIPRASRKWAVFILPAAPLNVPSASINSPSLVKTSFAMRCPELSDFESARAKKCPTSCLISFEMPVRGHVDDGAVASMM
jgi:hypothetical protein